MEVKIGLEVHCQLNTKSKLFCGCKNDVSDVPNVFTCPTCLGHPGAKPVFNKVVLDKALEVALALKCNINKTILFSRKSYFFPDLPNNYQITQYEFPLAEKGMFDGIRITRLHIEEDPGRLVHKGSFVLIDYNRSGTPLIEIVTEPDITSPERAKDFLNKLVNALEYLGVYSRSSEASLRCDVNVSINGGNRVEVKNVNGINDVRKVLEYEIDRQQIQQAKQETRGWDSEKCITYEMRTKESEQDYGYITESNLPSFEISDIMIESAESKLPELPHVKAKRFMGDYRITPEDAEVLTTEIELADLFEAVARKIDPVLAARWLRRELVKLLSLNKKKMKEIEIDEQQMTDLMDLYFSKKITDKIAKQLMEIIIEKPIDIKKYVEENNLMAVSDENELDKWCNEVINDNPQAVDDYLKGSENSLNFLMGKVMRLSKGKASPDLCKDMIKRKLNK
jgi:aspartyl-tRNA(Asn)/glutamyl-tRNA(Gln) amidotransferase subunit B